MQKGCAGAEGVQLPRVVTNSDTGTHVGGARCVVTPGVRALTVAEADVFIRQRQAWASARASKRGYELVTMTRRQNTRRYTGIHTHTCMNEAHAHTHAYTYLRNQLLAPSKGMDGASLHASVSE